MLLLFTHLFLPRPRLHFPIGYTDRPFTEAPHASTPSSPHSPAFRVCYACIPGRSTRAASDRTPASGPHLSRRSAMAETAAEQVDCRCRGGRRGRQTRSRLDHPSPVDVAAE